MHELAGLSASSAEKNRSNTTVSQAELLQARLRPDMQKFIRVVPNALHE